MSGISVYLKKKSNGFPTDIDVFAHKISLLLKKKIYVISWHFAK
jgi:hypothetical protein